jgi:hypothetical protein
MALAVTRLWLVGVLALWLASPLRAQPPPPSAQPPALEYGVKAQFLQNFLSFIEWPPAAFGGPRDPFRVCVIGADVFGPTLDPLARETVQGRPIVVERLKDEEEAARCRVVFVPAADDARLPTIMRVTRASGVLVIGETPRALEGCAAIALMVEQGYVRFHVNMAALRHHHLTPSSKLLRIARDRVDYPTRCRS